MLSLALRSLWARRLTYGLVFVQLIIGIFCLTLAASVWDSTRVLERRARQLAPLNTVDAWLMDCPRLPVEAAVDELRQDPAVAHVAVMFALGMDQDNSQSVGIDEATAAVLPLRASAGRWFEPNDFHADDQTPLPVVLGAAVQPELAIGSSFSNAVADDLLVIGRLKPGELFVHANGGATLGAIVPADEMILMPSGAIQRQGAQARPDHMVRWLVYPRHSPDEAAAAMERVWAGPLQSVGFPQDGGWPEPGVCHHTPPTTLSMAIQEHYSNNRQLLAVVAAIAGAILSIGLLGYSGVALVAVERRTREFALRLAMGATTRALAGQVLWEMLLLSLLAGAVGIPLAGLLARQAGYGPSGMVILVALAAGALEAVLAALGPMLTIVRRPPAHFIRGGR